MSKGNEVIPVRISDQLLLEMIACIDRRNASTPNEPWTRSGFIRAAIEEKIAKMERSRGGKKRARSAGQEAS